MGYIIFIKDALAAQFLSRYFPTFIYIKREKFFETAVAFTAIMRLTWKVLSKGKYEPYSIHRFIREFFLFVYR